MNKDQVFKMIQNFLKKPPLIVWGSGGTVSFGLPSMWALNESLKKEIEDFDTANDNLEEELGNDKYKNQMSEIRSVIWNDVNAADTAVLNQIISNNTAEYDGIRALVDKFIGAHPHCVDIVTTNYDRVIEHLLSFYGIAYTDGFNGKTLSRFDEKLFRDKDIVNLVKVHGSLNWFDIDGEIRYLSSPANGENPQFIVPGKNKYQEAYNSPYRELIQKSDNLIKKAPSFLAVGFGFNDMHLTPKIKSKVKEGTPIVLITKKISDSSYSELKSAEKCLMLEEAGDDTKAIYKDGSSEGELILQGNYWQLQKFMEIL